MKLLFARYDQDCHMNATLVLTACKVNITFPSHKLARFTKLVSAS